MNKAENLNLAEKFILLAMHPVKSRYLIGEPSLNAGLIGAILLDLSMENKLLINNHKLEVKDSKTSLSETHRQILAFIAQNNKKQNIKAWIRKLNRNPGLYRKQILYSLKNKGLVKIENKKFLFIPYIKASLIKSSERDTIISMVKETLIHQRKTDKSISALLGLVEACKMHRIISKDKAELRLFKTKLNEIMKSDAIAVEVDSVIREVQAAIFVAITASTVVVHAGK